MVLESLFQKLEEGALVPIIFAEELPELGLFGKWQLHDLYVLPAFLIVEETSV